jgi:kinetochore protein Mis13/DSN1
VIIERVSFGLIIVNHEEAPNSLLIVRAQDSQPSQPQPSNHADSHPLPLPRSSSQHPTNSSLPHRPASKRFKAGSQPPDRPKATSQTRAPTDNNVVSDVEVEKDVRAMDDEADKLRRLSRARTIIDPSLLASQANVQFQSRPETSGSSRKGKSKVVDITVPLPEEEIPTIQRNKQMRASAMAAITNGRSQELPETPRTTPSRHRRKGSVSARGKRVSSSFEVTGNISKYFCVVPFFPFVSFIRS